MFTAIIYKSCIFSPKNLSLQSKVTRELRGNGTWQMWLLTSCNQEMLSSAFCGTDKHQFSGLFAPNLGSICSSHTGGAQYKWADIIGPQVPKIEIHGVPRTKEEWQYNEERLQTLRSGTKYEQKRSTFAKCQHAEDQIKRDNVEWWSAKEEIPRQGRLY